ncbi:OmpH family outer membrane protein [Parabacteroides sp. Marseille-P3160]|uniref:OmpH family outer membrane protein n=1 Tax=Parabacteroides sp. Marseille-P3160 TaxID=1917887 RepID=UPI0009BABAB3|nr:OmpH family outer membrane protein [Parabacteroides sp. Marseille-P3160]
MDRIWEIISGILLLGNIPWFLYVKAERKKHNAEANQADAEAEKVKIDLQQDQYDYLTAKLTQYQKEYREIQEQFNAATDKYTKELIAIRIEFSDKINEKCNEIAETKSKVTFYRGFRCYKSDCKLRDQVYKKKEKDGDNKIPEGITEQ